MALRWRYFIGAVVLFQFLPLEGAPRWPLAAGIAAAGIWNLWCYRKERTMAKVGLPLATR